MTWQFSAGGIVFKKSQVNLKHQTPNSKHETLWLVRKPAANPEYRGKMGWTLPKGLIDEGEKLEETAVREVQEEAGVVAKIVTKLPTVKIFFYDQNKERVMKFITYFVMEYVEDAPEGHDRETEETKWVNLADGLQLLAFSSEKKLLKQAIEKMI